MICIDFDKGFLDLSLRWHKHSLLDWFRIRILLESDLAGQHVPPHPPVTKKAEPGIYKGGGLVVFKEEMSYPGKGVALYKSHGNQSPHRSDGSAHEQHQSYRGTDKVATDGKSGWRAR